MTTLLQAIFTFLFKLKLTGQENLSSKKQILYFANHLSYLDGFLLALFLPKEVAFVMDRNIYEKKLVKLSSKFRQILPIDLNNPYALKTLIQEINNGRSCMIFPEGRMSTTGGLMKIQRGISMIVMKTNCHIISIAIDGAENSKLTYLKEKKNHRLFPPISLSFSKPFKIAYDPNNSRQYNLTFIANSIFDKLSNQLFQLRNRPENLLECLYRNAIKNGFKRKILIDVTQQELSYKRLFLSCFILGKKINEINSGEHIGLMLPTANAGIVTILATMMYQKIPCMLNYRAGFQNIQSACQLANLKTIVCSRTFVEKGKLESLIAQLEQEFEIIYLEDIRKKITLKDKLTGISKLKNCSAHLPKTAAEKPAVILFTSGSEGNPKGVVLSHQNIISNVLQVQQIYGFNLTDKLFNALPIFHSFGLTVGCFLPLFTGIQTFQFSNPLLYKIIPELVYQWNATIILGTNTFLLNYAKKAHNYDFHTLKFVIAGAEKLKDITQNLWNEKFGLRILQGYGVTETSPVLSANTPIYSKIGSVGKLLPGLEYKLGTVNNVNKGGELIVKGPNIMMGYLQKDGNIKAPPQGWYQTGDIVEIDDDGFVTIVDRMKRFAKIAGEMISLTAVEEFYMKCWKEYSHAVVNFPDSKKGEKLILLTTYQSAQRQELINFSKEFNVSNLFIPAKVFVVKAIPLLGNGKTDYPQIKLIAQELLKQ